jgi:hypothetical protein
MLHHPHGDARIGERLLCILDIGRAPIFDDVRLGASAAQQGEIVAGDGAKGVGAAHAIDLPAIRTRSQRMP